MDPIEFSVASALFIIMLGVLILYSSYVISDYYKETKDYQAKYESVLISKQLLSDETSSSSLISSLYRRKIIIKNDLATQITGYVNVPVVFDSNCEKKAFNNTVRVVDNSSNEVNFTFSNTVFCDNIGYIKYSDVRISLTLNGNEEKTLYIIYSPETLISPKDVYYSYPTNITSSVSYKIYPEEELKTLSISKLMNATNMTYEEIKKLANSHDIYVEIMPA